MGQSVDGNEWAAQPFRKRGLQIVRYSPKERNIPNYAGEDALIRFYKDPAEWHGWIGDWEQVGNVTQDLARRDPFTNYGFWKAATEGLPTLPAGPGSEAIGGTGALPYDAMREYLRHIRCYLYTGTQPASYTLGLIEAMMTGVPVVSIPASYMALFPYGPHLFEGQEIADFEGSIVPLGMTRTTRGGIAISPDPAFAAVFLRDLLRDHAFAQAVGKRQRQRAIDLFGKDRVARDWATFLGVPVPQLVPA